MAAENPSIKHVEVDGIEMAIDLERFEDPRFTYALGKLSDETVNSFEKLKFASKMLDTLFGDDTYRIMCELADKNGGKLNEEQWKDFYARVMESVSAKN
ncbi:MAG TPA: hypothetical protein DCP91_05705 [Eggerthellaceae bacterium]|nr:hypothetical protein [Eggerthellaceae bacterium]